jgi:hypothetical protein
VLFANSLRWNYGKVDTILDDQERTLKKAGVLEEAVEENEDTTGEFECSVCGCDYPFSETSTLECGHRFCNECWGQSIESIILILESDNQVFQK